MVYEGNFALVFLAFLVASASSSSLATTPAEERHDGLRSLSGVCRTPLQSTLRTLRCIERGNAKCAAAGYNPKFVKKHNGIRTNDFSGIATVEFWEGAFSIVDLVLDFNYKSEDKRQSKQQVNLRYVETVNFIDGQTFLQYEHAIVTVDRDCKMLRWDQYGDNKEQIDVDNAAAEIVAGL